jgi:CIC family chloride channel protein
MAAPRRSCVARRRASRKASADGAPTRRAGVVHGQRLGAAIVYAAAVSPPPPRAREPILPPVPSVRRWLGRLGGTLTLAVLAGVLAGLAAVALRSALHLASAALVGRFADPGGPEIWSLRPEILFFPVLGGLASGVFVQGLLGIPPAHGTNQLVQAFHRRDGVLPLAGPAARAAACVGVIASGGSAGPEGPIAGLGAAIGSSLGRAFALTPRARRTLLVAGCAAGVGAIFRCPLGGALFACSIPYRRPELEGSALVAAFIASAVGYATLTSFTGFGGFLLADADRLAFASALELPVYVALGVACGGTAVLLSQAMKHTEHAFARLAAVPLWLRPALGGLAAGALACALPQVMDGEYRVIQNALDGSFFADAAHPPALWVALLAALVLGKTAATAFTVGSGGSGGVLGPSLWIGGAVGALLGAASEWVAPGALPPAVKSALIPVGMGGVLAGALRTPIAAIVMVMEMTGGYGLIVPLMIVCVSAYLVGARYGLIEDQVPGLADSPAHAGDTVIGLLERVHVHEAMRGVWPAVVDRATPLAGVVSALPAGDAPLAVVLDQDRVAGVIAVAELRDLLGTDELPEAVIAEDVMATHFPTLAPGDSLYEALTRLERSKSDALPVVDDDGAFLGVLTRAAVHERVVGGLGGVREQLLREHAGLAAFEEQSQLVSLLSGLPAPEAGAIARIPVDAELVGRSLRDVDFRRTRGGVVLAIQTAQHGMISPPDPARPLRADDRLVVLR